MSSQALREAAAFLLAQAEIADGKPAPAGFDMNDKSTWWPAMLEQFRKDALPHAWRDWTSGMDPSEVGDNDAPDEDFLRKFEPFMRAATQAKQTDSTGGIFFFPNVKKRGGIGPQGWDLVKWETRRLWTSPWGVAWRNDPLNLQAGLVPRRSVSAEARDYPPIILWMQRDVVLGSGGANLVQKSYRLLPLPAADGGAPITRH